MRNHKVAIQGGLSSYHDLAAKKYFGEEVDTVECGTFREVCERIVGNEADFGVIAIENKIAGSILLNYHLIENFELKIIGEIYLPLEMHLLGKPGAKLTEVREVVSHPMAIGQSQEFLSSLRNVKVTEYKDTATSAEMIAERDELDVAVIGGPSLAKLHGLDVLAEDVCDEKNNYTRFYIITKHSDLISKPDKASISFRLPDEPGHLYQVLGVFKKYDLNLTKIQSVPIPDVSNRYSFHMDVSFPDEQLLKQALGELVETADHMRVLGIYEGANI
jgi:prephenate dehydratase